MKTEIIGFLRMCMLGLALLHIGVLPTQANDKAQAKQETKISQTININKASVDELIKLPRIGPVMAKRIVDFREQHGKFSKLEEIMNVRGIGAKTFENIKALISVE